MPKLLNLSQIEGGKILRNFLTAYPASQTTTKIEKKDKTLYSAEELLSELKSSMDSLLGDGSSGSSIDDRIKNSIKTINEKTITDYTRLFIRYFDSDGTSSDKGKDIELAKLPNSDMTSIKDIFPDYLGFHLTDDELKTITPEIPYPLYYINNSPVYTNKTDSDGNHLNASIIFHKSGDTVTYEFKNYPYEKQVIKKNVNITDETLTIDTDKRSVKFQHPYVKDVIIKDKDGNAVDKNLYYLKPIQGILQFVHEQDASNSYTASYTYTDEQINYIKISRKKSDSLPAGFKFYPIETIKFGDLDTNYLLDNEELNTIYYQNAIDKLQTQLSKNTDVIQQIVNTVADSSVQQALQVLTDELNHRLSKIESKVSTLNSTTTDIFEPKSAQTVFSLSKVPTESSVNCYINGIKYQENTYFIIDRSTIASDGNQGFIPTLTWTFTKSNNGFDLDEHYLISVDYLVDDSKTVYVPPKTEETPEE